MNDRQILIMTIEMWRNLQIIKFSVLITKNKTKQQSISEMV